MPSKISNNNFLTLMDQFFDDNFRPLAGSFSKSFGIMPALNVKEFKDRYEISLTVPGIEASKAKVELRERILNISYEQQTVEKEEIEDIVKEEEGEMLRQEYSEFISFTRSVALPKNVDEDSVSAKYTNGILKVIVKKLPESQPKSVNIEVE